MLPCPGFLPEALGALVIARGYSVGPQEAKIQCGSEARAYKTLHFL